MQIVLGDFMSLDGVVQAPGGPEEDTGGGFIHGAVDAVLRPGGHGLGDRRGHGDDGGAAVRLARLTDDGRRLARPRRRPVRRPHEEILKYVASRALTSDDLTWSNSTVPPAEDAIGARRGLRARDGNGLQTWGGASFAAQLVEHDLVDEYRLMIEPVQLGGGMRVSPDDGWTRLLELVSTTTASTGVQVCTYRLTRR